MNEMTLDITIGKLVDKETWAKHTLHPDEYKYEYEECARVGVIECPESKTDVSKLQSYPKRAYRSMSYGNAYYLCEYLKPRGLDFSEQYTQMKLKTIIDKINNLKEPKFANKSQTEDALSQNELIAAQIRFIKYWSNIAIKLYGDDAGLELS